MFGKGFYVLEFQGRIGIYATKGPYAKAALFLRIVLVYVKLGSFEFCGRQSIPLQWQAREFPTGCPFLLVEPPGQFLHTMFVLSVVF